MSIAANTKEHSIPPPNGEKQPLKVNVYWFMRSANSALTPLFPYLDEGSIVPTGTLTRGQPNGAAGYFFHENSVEEIVICFGAKGAKLQPGQVACMAMHHGVGNFLADPNDPDSFYITTITQRQSVGVRQHEAVLFRCLKCQETLAREEFEVESGPGCSGDGASRRFPPIDTIVGSHAAALAVNELDTNRECPNCGATYELFPMHLWGFDSYVSRTWVAEEARQSLDSAAAQVNE